MRSKNDLPLTVVARSFIKKSAGLGGGVFEYFGDFGSVTYLEATFNAKRRKSSKRTKLGVGINKKRI